LLRWFYWLRLLFAFTFALRWVGCLRVLRLTFGSTFAGSRFTFRWVYGVCQHRVCVAVYGCYRCGWVTYVPVPRCTSLFGLHVALVGSGARFVCLFFWTLRHATFAAFTLYTALRDVCSRLFIVLRWMPGVGWFTDCCSPGSFVLYVTVVRVCSPFTVVRYFGFGLRCSTVQLHGWYVVLLLYVPALYVAFTRVVRGYPTGSPIRFLTVAWVPYVAFTCLVDLRLRLRPVGSVRCSRYVALRFR